MSIAYCRQLRRDTSGRSNSYWEAEERADALLRSWLSPEQRVQYHAKLAFEVIGCDSCKRYRIWKGRVFNIQELDQSGRPTYSWCFGPLRVATSDVNLAQKIALEAY